MSTTQGFLSLLFDMSFSEFLTIRVIKFLYILGIIVAAIATISLIVTGFARGAGTGILFLIISPLIFLLYVFFARLWCEIIIVLFRIAENTSQLVELKSKE